jgi:hypothetical protein
LARPIGPRAFQAAKTDHFQNIAMNPDLSTGDDLPKTFAARTAVKIESFGLSPKKALEYLVMFMVLGITVYLDLERGYRENKCPMNRSINIPEIPLIFLKYFIFTSWPFGLMAACDSTWKEKDAGNVFIAAYIAATVVWFHHTGCGLCIWAAFLRTVPFLIGGIVAHRIGHWRHRWRMGK